MVHLTSIPHQHEAEENLVSAVKRVHLQLANDEDCFTTSVYGSKFAIDDLPKHEMPEREMPKEVAYRMIKDELSLDGNPMLNLASFVTTYMEEEAEKLMAESFSKNFIDYEEYPQSADIQNRCVSMIGRLFHAPIGAGEGIGAVGTSCVGSSEAIMLAVLAMKKRWKNQRQAEGKPCDRPNIIMSSAVQVCWEKAARYFEVEEKLVYCSPDRFVIDPQQTVDLVDENTIGICVILGTTYTGEYEDVKAVNDLLNQRGLDTPIHVDAASGGFVAPFVVPDLSWDFRCDRVVSINVSGHKYGLVYPGVGWVIWRSAEFLPKELVFNINYLGADQASFTLNFSKGASQVIGQYYQLIRLGKHGYRAIMSNLTRTADYLADSLEALGFIIMSQKSGAGLPLVAFRLSPKEDRDFDEFTLAHQLRVRGWVVPAYTMAPHTENLKMLRVVVREDFTRNRCDALICDVRLSLSVLDEMDKKSIERHQELIHRHHTSSGKATHQPAKYRVSSNSAARRRRRHHAAAVAAVTNAAVSASASSSSASSASASSLSVATPHGGSANSSTSTADGSFIRGSVSGGENSDGGAGKVEKAEDDGLPSTTNTNLVRFANSSTSTAVNTGGIPSEASTVVDDSCSCSSEDEAASEGGEIEEGEGEGEDAIKKHHHRSHQHQHHHDQDPKHKHQSSPPSPVIMHRRTLSKSQAQQILALVPLPAIPIKLPTPPHHHPLAAYHAHLRRANCRHVNKQKEKHSLQGKTGKTHAIC